MEYVEGESLRQRLGRQGPLPIEDAVRIAAEVGDALQYAHENGVIHRDIKPENILLSRGHALVSDFGIAKLMEERGGSEGPTLTGAGIAVGTAAYMSPEQASGDQRIDPRSDVYSLAAVLYEMLAGEAPFYRTQRASDRGTRDQRSAATDPHGAPRASGAPRARARARAREVARRPAPHGSSVRRLRSPSRTASAASLRRRSGGSRPCAGQPSSGGSCGVNRASISRPGWCSSRRDGIRWGRGCTLARLERQPARRVFRGFGGGQRRRLPAVPGLHASRSAWTQVPPINGL